MKNISENFLLFISSEIDLYIFVTTHISNPAVGNKCCNKIYVYIKKSVAVLNKFYKRVCKIPAHSAVTYKENSITFAIVYIYIHIVYRYNIDIIFQYMNIY